MIPYGKQHITNDDIEAVIEVLRSPLITQGHHTVDFEKDVAKKIGVEWAVTANSATSALHIACLGLGLSTGDSIWTSPITFVATANCAIYCGAHVDFVDIDPTTYNICVKSLEEKLFQHQKQNLPLPKIVIAVHLSGQSCEMRAIKRLSTKFGFRVIEDASHAIGGKYNGEYIGNCKYSDITVFSFHPVKIITTAEGGLATTNDKKLAEKMKTLRSHGIVRDIDKMTREPHGPWYYEQVCLGYNYRMNEIQAALGLSQLKRLDKYVTIRNELANIYDKELSGLPIVLPKQNPDIYSSRHLYIVLLEDSTPPGKHSLIFNQLHQSGIGVNLHYIPVYRQPYYSRLGYKKENYPISENYYNHAISLPIYPTMSMEEQEKVISVFMKILNDKMV